MSDSPLSREEIYAAAAAHDELGPEYSDAVVALFLEKVDKEIDARVDARLAGRHQPAPPAAPRTFLQSTGSPKTTCWRPSSNDSSIIFRSTRSWSSTSSTVWSGPSETSSRHASMTESSARRARRVSSGTTS